MEELAEGGNLACFLIIVVIFMELGGTHRLGEDFKVIIWGPSHIGLVGTMFCLGRWPLETTSKDFHLAV